MIIVGGGECEFISVEVVRVKDGQSEVRVMVCTHHRVYRVVMAAFWRTFHHEGKISPGW